MPARDLKKERPDLRYPTLYPEPVDAAAVLTAAEAADLTDGGATTLHTHVLADHDHTAAAGDGGTIPASSVTGLPVYAPPDAHYLTTQAESGLSAEANLGALSTGIVKVTVAAGVATPSIAAATDLPDHTHEAGQGGPLNCVFDGLVGSANATTSWHLVDASSSGVFGLVIDDTTGYTIELTLATPTASNTLIFPASGSLITSNAVANLSSKTILAVNTNMINCNTTGPRFRNGTSTTQYMVLDLSLLTAARTKKFLDVAGTSVEKVGTDLSLTGQTATITTANLLASAPAGFYRATVYVVATASTVGTLTVTLGWTDAQQAQTSTVITTGVIAAGAYATATLPMMTSGTNNITYATVVGGTALTYNLYIVLERLA